MAIELDQHEAERKFCPYVTYAHEKLVNFVESRKQMTIESYKFFVEHCYNQFVTHEAFHTSAVSKTTTKDITGSGLTEVSTKLSGYVWVGSKTKLVHIPGGQADDVVMLDVETQDEEEVDEETKDLPSLKVKIEEVVEDEPQQAQDDQQDDACSRQQEVASVFPGYSSQLERPEFPKARGPTERYGNFILSQLTLQEFRKIRQWCFDLTTAIPEEDREDHDLPASAEEVNTMQMAMFVEVIALETHSSFMQTYPTLTHTNVDPHTFHSIQLACRRVKEENQNISIMTFLEEANPELPPDPENKKEIEHMTPENKHLILETDNAVLTDCTVQCMNMLNEDLQQRILERVTIAKKEIEDEQDVEEEEEIKKEPEVPPSKVSMSTQTEPTEEVSQPGSSRQREAPESNAGSRQREVAKKEKNINDDDTAPPEKKPPTQVWYGQDISGNEADSVLRKLSNCFSDGYHSIWAGFHNLGFPALPNNRHMLWHMKYRKTTEMHRKSWYDIPEEILMQEYINRHKDEKAMDLLDEIRNKLPYGCSDPRLHIRARQEVDKFTEKATGRHQEDFESLHSLIEDYIKDHHDIPYAIILQLLACRYLGAGMLDTEKVDHDYPYRSTRSLSCMFWNLGNWNRKYHSKCPLPEHLEKFRPHIRFDLDAEHRPTGDKPLYNNVFVTAVRNLAAHLFMNCEAGSLFEHRERLEESGWTTCFNDFTDLMCAA